MVFGLSINSKGSTSQNYHSLVVGQKVNILGNTMAFNKFVVLAVSIKNCHQRIIYNIMTLSLLLQVICITVQYGTATPVPHVHELVEKKVDFLKDKFEHGKQGMYHLKDKTVDAVETGVGKVKGFAAAGVEAVKSAGSTVAGVVVAPFHKVGQVLHKKIDYLANKVLPAHENEEHVEVPVPGYAFTPEHGLAPTAVTHEETHVYVKDAAPVVHAEEHKPAKEKEVTGNYAN
jgi:hypothetical protein